MKKPPFKSRSLLVTFSILIWSALIVWRLIDLQVLSCEYYREKAQNQQERVITLNPRRGTIFDRKGRELAVSVDVASIYAVPQKIEHPRDTARELSRILTNEKVSYHAVLKKLKKDDPFVWIKRQVPPSRWSEIERLKLEGIGSVTESKRYFPKKDMAAHVLGYVGVDEVGLAGIESYYDSEIRGKPIRMMVIRDARGDKIVVSNQNKKRTVRGCDVYLTIDEIIQYYAERELGKAVDKYDARGGTVIVMNPRTGEILALANRPHYNPNIRFSSFPEVEWPNRAVSECYEPGSTFKVVTAAVALEENKVTPGEMIYCGDGHIEVAGKIIRDHESYADLDFTHVIVNSSNVGAIKVGMRLDRDVFYRYLRRFGFGNPTGIDLPGESGGILRETTHWSKISAASISMGQEVAVTPLQMLQALNTVACGGVMPEPAIIQKIKGAGGQRVKKFTGPAFKRVISKETADKLKWMLASVVKEGTGRNAAMEGYTIAGKTGTAQKIDETGGYSETKFIASFMGFFPVENPRISIIVVINEPKGAYYGGTVAAPVFRNIASAAALYKGIPSRSEDRFIKTVYRKSLPEDAGKIRISSNLDGPVSKGTISE